MKKLFAIGRKIIPTKLFKALQPFWHLIWIYVASFVYGYPSKNMVVIGITGTKGKTSTANYIWSVLNASGIKTGLIGTANIRIDNQEKMNTYHMTMPGPFLFQKTLLEMKKAGCTHVVVEITSEGIKLNRQKGLSIDIAIFTNLYPEHLPSHGGSFEKYKETKGIIFKKAKTIIVNADSEHSSYYLNNPAKNKLTFSLNSPSDFKAENVEIIQQKTTFKVNNDSFSLSIPGIFNVYNALGALAVARALNLPTSAIQKGLSSLTIIPGRMEKIDCGQTFTVFVDYAHEKQSMSLLLQTAKAMGGRIILLLGAEGGGRDKAKRPAMGELAGKFADYVIVSNVDPYDDDPIEIIEDIAKVAENHGKIRNQNLFTIEDRREGIKKALSLATTGDIVLITGKGSEQSMIIGSKIIQWDDRVVVREELKKT
ncbi:MAG: UDP-N-acetylmuramoyl-L-alanyl-D-glutamate--2,6-diaminopimelate ligase [Patescibacteria group bacterium]|nr:UDP-N-acetylmuramoyl-L-alanyl-D-glutamate--2,6-diaminopimelate ligase [Patescibacteria group bacterium]